MVFMFDRFNLALWSLLLVWLTGSVWRDIVKGKPRDLDAMWSLWWFTSLIFACYRLKSVMQPVPDADNVTLGLRISGTMLAFAIMWKRYKREGWRW